MDTFRFRLQTILELRQREHEQSERALARAESDLRVARHRLTEATNALERAQADMSAALARPSSTTPLAWYQSWIVRLSQQRAQCAQAVADHERDCSTARAAWSQTRRRLHAMERLREIQAQRWRAALAAEEQRQLDALATMRFAAGAGGPERTIS
jgi:flagellar export protein FliJ